MQHKRPKKAGGGTMPGSQPKHLEDESFDLSSVREIIDLMKTHDLTEVDLRRDKQRIRISRGLPTFHTVPPPASPPPTPFPSANPQVSQPTISAVPTAPAANTVAITSPMVGTFYSKPNPDSAPFVKVGDLIGPETVVCIIEAMKVFNEIQAEVSGKIVSIHASNGDSVEFGMPLFTLETSTK
jgi:acetyl-CoA carboxylase biotin carboxyl carrier protein